MAFIANCKKLPVNSLAQSSQTNRIKPLLVSQGDVLVEEHQDAHLISCDLGSGELEPLMVTKYDQIPSGNLSK